MFNFRLNNQRQSKDVVLVKFNKYIVLTQGRLLQILPKTTNIRRFMLFQVIEKMKIRLRQHEGISMSYFTQTPYPNIFRLGKSFGGE